VIHPSNNDAAVRSPDAALRSSDISGMLRRATTQSGKDLFAAYGLNLRPTDKGLEGDTPAAVAFLSVAGFSGPSFSGFVVLGTTETVLRRCNNTASASCDWMGELGNQFLGRIKNCLLRQGIRIYRVPPAVMSCSSPSLFYAPRGVKPVTLSDHGDKVLIWTEFEPAFEESGIALLPDDGVLAEGDVILF
jgi:hypothetical protein